LFSRSNPAGVLLVLKVLVISCISMLRADFIFIDFIDEARELGLVLWLARFITRIHPRDYFVKYFAISTFTFTEGLYLTA
jgi:hypothetical protein